MEVMRSGTPPQVGSASGNEKRAAHRLGCAALLLRPAAARDRAISMVVFVGDRS